MSKVDLQYTSSLEETVLVKPGIWTQTRETLTLKFSEYASRIFRFEWYWHFSKN